MENFMEKFKKSMNLDDLGNFEEAEKKLRKDLTGLILKDGLEYHAQTVDQKSTAASIKVRLEGNRFFAREGQGEHCSLANFQAYLLSYTKSIAYAPPDSEELAAGFYNRSILLEHAIKYDLALVDVDRGLKISSAPPALRTKLLIMKLRALRALGREIGPTLKEVKESKKGVENADIRSKLDVMLKRALKAIFRRNPDKIESECVPEVDTPSIEAPCASEVVEIKYDKKFGRHLTVNRDVEPGEILAVEKPYVVQPMMEKNYLVCTNCLNFAWTALPCDACPCVVFCGERCKEDAWKRYHDVECQILQRMGDKEMFDPRILMQYRSFILALREPDGSGFSCDRVVDEIQRVESNSDRRTRGFCDDRFLSNRFRCLYSLQTNKQEIRDFWLDLSGENKDVVEQRALITMKIFREIVLTEASPEFFESPKWQKAVKTALEDIFCILITNRYYVYGEIEPDDPEVYGSVVAPCISLLNHSCSPNVGWTYKNGKMVIFSLRPIRKNEQMFISYGFGITKPKSERQENLKDKYHFACNCLCCKEDIFLTGQVLENEENLFDDWLKENAHALKPSSTSTLDLRKKLITAAKSRISDFHKKYPLRQAMLKASIFEQNFQLFHSQVYGLLYVLDRCR